MADSGGRMLRPVTGEKMVLFHMAAANPDGSSGGGGYCSASSKRSDGYGAGGQN
eukprot:COSAG01_NODE_159_length_23702_cov_119.507585_18_plen_54_part_00